MGASCWPEGWGCSVRTRSGLKSLFRAGLTLFAGAVLCMSAPASARAGAGEITRSAPATLRLSGRVTDLAAVLSADQRSALAADLIRAESRTRHQIVIATVSSLNGRDIASYARDLGNHAAIGRKLDDKGIVILLAPNEQLVRIAVGRGLETVFTDALCQQIIDEVMLPQFREGKLFDGLSGAITAISAKL